jgi:hypothetical protein
MHDAAETRDLWLGLDALLDAAGSDAALADHRLHLLAARRRRARGLTVPSELRAAERWAALGALDVPVLLARARAAYAGTLVVIKGPEVAARYPDPLTRPFGDIDLLADDAEAAQAALGSAGFQEVGDSEKYRGIHHLKPLVWPGLTLTLEVHSRPKWLEELPPAPTMELLAAAMVGADGIGRLPADHHAVLLAMHAWAHAPLGRAGDLLDVLAMTEAGNRISASALADRWGCGRVFGVTLRAADSLFLDRRRPLAARLWARHLFDVRDRTVFEAHATRHLEPAWRVRRLAAPAAFARSALADLRPGEGESWRHKGARARRALRSARDAKSAYDRRLAPIEPLATTVPITLSPEGRPR